MPAINLSDREKKIAILCAAVIGAYFIYNYVIVPSKNYYEDLRDSIEQNEVTLRKNQRIIALEGEISQKYRSIEGIMKMMGEDEMNLMFTDIDRIAGTAGLEISDIKPLEMKEKEFFNQYLINIEGQANISSIVKFIYELQSRENMMSVQKLRLSAVSQRGASGALGLKASMVISRVRIP